MDSLNQDPKFCCNSSEDDIGFSGILQVFVHHARNIHNICIYDNQDVYAKFSLTYNPDETVLTRVVVGGGKNPDFNQKLELKVNQIDAVLKCEIWMLSRARSLLEDQLLGFALVPISHIVSQGGKINSQDFSLSSTDLFHSPAGIVQLSVALCSSTTSFVSSPLNASANSSISSEVVLLDPKDYSRVEFPDINAATEDLMMVSQYFNHHASFLHLGSVSETGDYDSSNEKSAVKQSKGDADHGNTGRVFPGRVESSDLEADQEAMQQQIVDMYMKSMQQFTESLAKMKLPMGLDPSSDVEDSGNVIRVMEKSNKLDVGDKKKDGSRVFYGSRAFF